MMGLERLIAVMPNPLRLGQPTPTLSYLPPATLGYLYALQSDAIYLYAAAIALLASVWRHGIMVAIAGYGGEYENPLTPDERYQRLQAVIWRKGPPERYPESIFKGARKTELHVPSRYRIAALGALFSGIHVLSYFVSLYALFSNVQLLDFIGVFLLLALLVWGLQVGLWRIFPFISAIESRRPPDEDTDLRESLQQFSSFLTSDEELTVSELTLDPLMGGNVELIYGTEREMGETKGDFSRVGAGFAAFLNRSPYPCSSLEASFITTNGKEGHYEIRADWAESYYERELDHEEFLTKIAETADLEAGQLKVEQSG